MVKRNGLVVGKVEKKLVFTKKERCIKINGQIVFEQPKGDPKGSFRASYQHLKLPA